MSPKISVIIPVYNAEKYLRQCLDSVTKQSLKDIEVICINDGSTDASLDILNEYQLYDSRIKVLSQENLHAGVARNKGLDQATGEYIHFLDADDWIVPDAYYQWYAIAKDKDAEVCECLHKYYDNQTGVTTKKVSKYKNYITFHSLELHPKLLIFNAVVPWNKLYKREFLIDNKIRFNDLICVNDRDFYFKVVLTAKRFFTVADWWVTYRLNNEDSLIGKENRLKHYDCQLTSFSIIWKLFQDCDSNIKNLILQVLVSDLLDFYLKAKNSAYENIIKTELFKIFSSLDLSEIICNLGGTRVSSYLEIVKQTLSYSDQYPLLSTVHRIYESRLNAEGNSRNELKKDLRKFENDLAVERLRKDELKRELQEARGEYERISNSRSYKLGRFLSYPYRKTKGGIRCYRDNGLSYTINRCGQKLKGIVNITAKHISAPGRCGQKVIAPEMSQEKLKEQNLGLSTETRIPQVIVSLTSYPARISFVSKTVITLLSQSFKPNKLILWLALEEFPNKEKDLPEELVGLKKYGLQICWCENLHSYKKIIPTLRQYPQDIIVTADDDIYYDKDWLHLLINDYEKNKTYGNYVYCHRVTKFFKPDENWHIINASRDVYIVPTYIHKVCTGAGTLFPPKSLYKDVLNEASFLSLAPTNDDIWIWFMAILAGTRVKVIEKAKPNIKLVEGSQDVGALYKNNDFGAGLFWEDFKRLLNFYPQAETILDNEYNTMRRFDRACCVTEKERNEEYFRNVSCADRPAELMLWYYKRTKHFLYLDNPVSYSEKIQWAKLYESTPIKTRLADKYEVREWVREKIGEQYLIPLLGVWDNFDEIDFSLLPDKFVLKANHGSGWNVIVKDKTKLKIEETRKKIEGWLQSNFGLKGGQELHYYGIKPRIIAEEFVDSLGSLSDYKFLCFNGQVKYIWVDSDRFTDHRRDFFDLNWNHLDVIKHFPHADTPPKKPENFEEMLHLAEVLSEGFTFVRVDFYDDGGRIFFGEMTFTDGNGIEKIEPYSFAIELGSYIHFSSKLASPIA